MALLSSLSTSLCNASAVDPLYSPFTAGSATLAYSSAGVLMSFPASTTAATDGDITSARGDFTSDTISMRVDAVPASGTTADAELRVHTDASNWFRWVYEGGTLFAQQTKAGVKTTPFSIAYNSTTHLYWRLRESAGTVFWDTGTESNGIVTWTNQASGVHGMTITNMLVLIAGTTSSVQANPGTFIFRNINVVPPVPGLWQISGPDRYRMNASRRYLMPVNQFDPNPISAVVETITPDKWLGYHPDRLPIKDRRYAFPSFFSWDPLPLDNLGWRGYQPEYIRRVKERRYNDPYFFTWDPLPLDNLGWRGYQPDYLWRNKPRQAEYPDIFQWEPDPLDDLAWRPIYPDFIWRVKPRVTRYPSQFEIVEEVPAIWHRPPLVTYPDYIWKNKSRRHIVPAEYRYYDLIFQYCDPLTAWSSTDPVTTAWAGANPETTAWAQAAPQTTPWTANPADGSASWTPVEEATNDWDPTCYNN